MKTDTHNNHTNHTHDTYDDHCHEGHCSCHGHDHDHGEENPKKTLVRIIAGAALFGLSFAFPKLHLAFLAVSYIVLGGNVVLNAVKGLFHGHVFDENFLMTAATVGAAILGDYNEAVFVMLFYSVGEFAQDLAVDRSRDNIKELMDIEPAKARIVDKDGLMHEVDPRQVKVGDTVRVLAGELVPVDGTAMEKGAFLDTKAVTGESIPLAAEKGTVVLSGSIVTEAPLLMKATALYQDSTVSRILELVEQSEKDKAPTERFITKFAKIYTPVVTLLAVLLAVIPSLVTGEWAVWTHRALTFLVISCPCALVLSIPLSFFAGIGGAASNGILIKGGTHLQVLAKARNVVFDKTGTLTTGEFKVRQVRAMQGFTEDDVLETASILEKHSRHPMAKAICNERKVDAKAENVREIAGKGLLGTIDGTDVAVGSLELMKQAGADFANHAEPGSSVVYVAKGSKPAGYIVIGDTLKPNAAGVISKLKEMGIARTVMLSGDNTQAAQAVGKLAGIDEVHGSLLPQEKVAKIRELKAQGCSIYVGDGINDAPVLMASDCGIAMGGVGSASAIEAAGAVIMNDDLANIPLAIAMSAKTMGIAKQNIVFAIAVKVLCMILGALGITGMGVAVFADTGVALLCVLNSLRALKCHLRSFQ